MCSDSSATLMQSSQCDVRHERTPDSWFYTPVKNKQKLRTQKKRRAQLRQDKEVSASRDVLAQAAEAAVASAMQR